MSAFQSDAFQSDAFQIYGGTTSFNVYTLSPGGTLTFSGTALFTHIKTYAPSGALTFSGTAIEVHVKIYLPSGLVQFTGSAPLQFLPNGIQLATTKLPMTGAGQT